MSILEPMPVCVFSNIGSKKRVIWEMISTCTRRCSYCMVKPRFTRENYPDFSSILSATKKLKKLGYEDIQVTGGEFFLRKDAISILKALRDEGFSVAISTNGDLFTKKLVKELLSLSLRTINLSLDSHIPKINDKTRGKNGFKNTMQAIKFFANQDIRLRIHTVLTDTNKDTIQETPKFLHDLGIRLLFISPDLTKKEKFDPLLAEKLIKIKIENPDMTIHMIRIPLFKNQPYCNWKLCSNKSELLHIFSNGTIANCGWSKQNEIAPTNIYKENFLSIKQKLNEYNRIPSSKESLPPCL